MEARWVARAARRSAPVRLLAKNLRELLKPAI